MRFDLARLSLIPAFLLLLLLVVVAMCHTAEPLPPVEPLAAVVEEIQPETVVDTATTSATNESLQITFLGDRIKGFAARHTTWAHTLGALLIIISAMSLGRLTARHKLYGSNTMLAIPLYALCMVGIIDSGYWFHALVSSALFTFAVKNCCYANRLGFGFDNIFRGAMYLSLLIIIEPNALPIVLMLPVALWQFRRTTRESIVALCGLLIPIAALCYLNWALGGTFSAPAIDLYQRATTGDWLVAPLAMEHNSQIGIGLLLLFSLPAFLLFSLNSYTLSNRSRHTLLFVSKVLPLTALTLLMPAANESLIALIAVPATLLLPVLFIRTRRPIANTLFAFLVAAIIALRYLKF